MIKSILKTLTIIKVVYHRLLKTKIIITIILCLLSYLPIDGCTVVSIIEGETVYVGNNEDWYIPYPKYRIIPGNDSTFGHIIFSYNNNWGQGGMNEKGLFFDWVLQGEEATTWQPDPSKKDIRGNLSEEILSKCSSVDEALQFYEDYNEPIFKITYIVLVDTSGQSAFVSWENDELKIERCQGVCVGGWGGNKVVQKHKALEGPMNKDKMIELLDAGHQEGAYPTSYSNIYDLKKGLIHLYYYHNYKEEVILDLREELKKGAHSVELAEIFQTQIPRAKFRELQTHYIVKEIKTIPLKGWLVVLLLLGVITSGLVVLVEVLKRVLKINKSVSDTTPHK